MKNTFLLLFGLLFFSCESEKSPQEKINEMKCPIVLIAESPETNKFFATITLRDSLGKIESFICNKAFPASIGATFNPNDTIIKCQ